MKAHYCAGMVLFVTLLAFGCKNSEPTVPAGKEYPIKGKVAAVDVNKPSVKLDHEAIPELKMKAMVMDYAVENAKVLEGIKTGDQVQGQFKVESGKYIITRLEKR